MSEDRPRDADDGDGKEPADRTAAAATDVDPPDEKNDSPETIVAPSDISDADFTDVAADTREKDVARPWRWVITGMCVLTALYHLGVAAFQTMPTFNSAVALIPGLGAFFNDATGNRLTSLHLALGLGVIFLLYKPRGRKEQHEKTMGLVWTALGLGFMFYLWVAAGTDLSLLILPAIVLLLVQVTRYIPMKVGGMPLPDVALTLLTFVATFYIYLNADDLKSRAGLFTVEDFTLGMLGLTIILVAAQRAVGSALAIVTGAMLAYAFFGRDFPGFLAHSGKDLDQIVNNVYLGNDALFVSASVRAAATFIFLFLIFAALLQRTGMERLFTNLALAIAGGRTGGTAKVGVVTSILSGTITGSSVANTVSNGAFTIPMMKRSGYKKNFAGAVEAASSTGGQIMPPIMGAAVFIMVEIIEDVSYADVLKAALVPAVLFFVAQYVVVHFISKREGIHGLPRNQLPKFFKLIATRGYLLAPLVLILVILASGFSPAKAAVIAILTTIGVNLAAQAVVAVIGGRDRWRKMEDRLTFRGLGDGLADSTKMAIPVIAACAAAGIISAVVTQTPLSNKLVTGLLDVAETLNAAVPFMNIELVLVLFFSMIACLVLGIGLPTTANYVVTATLAAPIIIRALEDTSALPMAQIALTAHLFVLYFGVMADITPPVCLAAYAASGISGGTAIGTGVQAVRIAISGFIVPYMFVFSPGLLLFGLDSTDARLAIVAALPGIVCLGAAVAGFFFGKLNWIERTALIAAGLMLLSGATTMLAVGFVLGAAVLAYNKFTAGRGGSSGGAVPVVSTTKPATAES